MHFPQVEQLHVLCTFAQLLPGKLHTDGQRYLPLIVLRLPTTTDSDHVTMLGVVDRHHVVDRALEGQTGSAQLVFLLSTIHLQSAQRQGLQPETGRASQRPSTMPSAYGRVVAVPTWEAQRARLPYETLYTELLLDIGIGIVGVRTSTTAASLAESIGKPHIEPGDWLEVQRSRIDILGFNASAN